jgi:hypothetical protein
LIAILFFCIGSITLLSFCSILFVSTKLDLFGSHYKMLTNPPSVQSFVILLVYVFSIAIIMFVHFLFSYQIAICLMFIVGGSSILLSNSWFNYLYRCFCANKYEKMEIFRIQ